MSGVLSGTRSVSPVLFQAMKEKAKKLKQRIAELEKEAAGYKV